VAVQSALGEPLRAEIEVTSLTPEEASAPEPAHRLTRRPTGPPASTTTRSCPPPRFPVQRRPDGRPFIRLSSSRSVQEPFLDVIVELTLAAGRLVREYTLLVGPAAARPRPPRPRRAGARVSPADHLRRRLLTGPGDHGGRARRQPRRAPRRRQRPGRPRPRRLAPAPAAGAPAQRRGPPACRAPRPTLLRWPAPCA
jgi:pilus assembly protein FimV